MLEQRILDFISRHAERIGNEWFKLMEWMLIIATLSFASKFSDNFLVKGLWVLSIAILFVYCLFGYTERYLKSIKPIDAEKATWKEIVKVFIRLSIVFLLIMFFSQKIAQLAWEFATTLSEKLK
jgi:hypothetical protein